ncbi:hypothetical protein BJX64DRAFT_38537 [Aspergillus heterothallicus]
MLLFWFRSLESRASLPRLARKAKYFSLCRTYSTSQSDAWLDTVVGQPRDLFKYTSGRWLWDEEERLEKRYRVFNIRELQNAAAEAASSGPCIKLEKMHEDLNDKTFKLTMADGRKLIARIPYRNVGPPSLATASKVATLEFLRNVLRLPVPQVLAWNTAVDYTNPVGAEYVIMDLPPGDNLADVWSKTSFENKKQTVKDVVEIQRKLLSVKFLGYGCLFFTKDAPAGSRPATITGASLSSEFKQRVAKRFSIGPMVTRDYWNDERAKLEIDRGPWIHASKYIEAPARREIAWIRNYGRYLAPGHPSFFWRRQYSRNDHIHLLENYLSVAPFLLPKDESFLASHLWHRDFHFSNMFVDNKGHITNIIDWPNTYARPLYFENNFAPYFIIPTDEPGYNLPSAEQIKNIGITRGSDPLARRTNAMLLHTFDKLTKERNSLLARMMVHANRDTRRLPVCYARDLWDRDILDIWLALLSLQEKWKEMFRGTRCPIPTYRNGVRKADRARAPAERFWEEATGVLTKDGWTSHDNYVGALYLQEKLRTVSQGEGWFNWLFQR